MQALQNTSKAVKPAMAYAPAFPLTLASCRATTRRVTKLSLLLLAAGFALGGCMTSTRASLKGSPDASELHVVRTTSGLIWGPCMPAPGSVSSAYVIALTGERSSYAPGEFKIYHELPSGARFPLKAEGVIEVDRAKHTIRVDLTIGGKPCELNGQFAFAKGA